jgi:hypothetical protein
MNTKSLNDRLGRVKSGGLLGFLLGLSILLSGTIFYLSEILFIVSLIILFHKFRVDLLRLSVSLLVISFWLIFYFNSTILANEIVLVMLLVLIPSFSLYLNNDYVFKIAAGIKLLLTYSAYLAIILLFVQILTPSLSYWIDPCLYGSFRSELGCGIPPYGINEIDLQRLYGLASEPSTYGLTHAVLLSFIMATKGDALSTKFLSIQFFSIIATMSIIAIFLTLIVFVYYYIIQQKKIKKVRIALTISIIVLAINILLPELYNAISLRSFGRISDFVKGEDSSAFMRSSGTWYPVLEFYLSKEWNDILFGLGKVKYVEFLEGITLYGYSDGNMYTIYGQQGSAMATFLVSIGLIPVLAIILLMTTVKYNVVINIVTIMVAGFVILSTVAYSFSILAALVLVKISQYRKCT